MNLVARKRRRLAASTPIEIPPVTTVQVTIPELDTTIVMGGLVEQMLQFYAMDSIPEMDMGGGISPETQAAIDVFLAQELTYNWGDDSPDEVVTLADLYDEDEGWALIEHEYAAPGSYTITISGPVALVTDLDAINVPGGAGTKITGFSVVGDVTVLEAGANTFAEFPDISGLTKLKALFLYNTNAWDFISDGQGNNNLIILAASRCEIPEIDLSGFPALKIAMLSYNGISDISIHEQSSIEYYDLTNNALTSMDWLDSGKDKIRALILAYNNFASFNADGFTALQTFACDIAPISEFDITKTPELVMLSASGCVFTTVSMDAIINALAASGEVAPNLAMIMMQAQSTEEEPTEGAVLALMAARPDLMAMF